MKKLKKFQKFALSAKQISQVRGGLLCHYGGTNNHFSKAFPDTQAGDRAALAWCSRVHSCAGCF